MSKAASKLAITLYGREYFVNCDPGADDAIKPRLRVEISTAEDGPGLSIQNDPRAAVGHGYRTSQSSCRRRA